MDTRYMKDTETGIEFFKNPLNALNGDVIYNPTHEMLIENGWTEYVPPEPTFEEVKANKLREINSICDVILSSATSTYPDTEVLTFDQQKIEAQAYLTSNNPEDAPLLAALASGRGIELDDLVQRVIAKSNAFTQLSGYVIGQRQALEDKLDTPATYTYYGIKDSNNREQLTFTPTYKISEGEKAPTLTIDVHKAYLDSKASAQHTVTVRLVDGTTNSNVKSHAWFAAGLAAS